MAVKWPAGFRSAGIASGIKATGPDLGLIVVDAPSPWAGVFTRNAAAAAPVRWCRSLAGGYARGVIVNSGNANAATGRRGEEVVAATAEAVASALGCEREEVLVASTGSIGHQLPLEPIVGGVPVLASVLEDAPDSFAQAIMTTDTHPKTARARAGDAVVVGVAKGAAMLAPNMATMLAFIATDAVVPQGTLQELLSAAVETSFNRISVDACESTNDSVVILSSMRVKADPDAFAAAVVDVCRSLAEQIWRDAEGGSKFVRIVVEGAEDDAASAELGRAVAASALWRAAVHGGDPNWGRIVSALGAVDRSLDLGSLRVAIGDASVFADGEPVDLRDAAAKEMVAEEFTVTCSVGSGPGFAEILTSDLSPEYVRLNAEGTS